MGRYKLEPQSVVGLRRHLMGGRLCTRARAIHLGWSSSPSGVEKAEESDSEETVGDKTKGSERVSRRGFLANAGKIAAAAGVGAVGLSGLASAHTSGEAEVPSYPWAYKKVDPEKVYWNGVALYPKYGCGQGAFEALLTELGSPFNTVPPSILKFGEGGVSGWGSHCGALLGSSAIISLVTGGSAASGQMIKELTGWYTESLGSGSPLCHVSVTEWSKANGVKVESQERKDRCARVTGETAKKAALLLNAWADTNQVAAVFNPRETVVACQTCHGANGTQTVRAGVLQDCVPCHTDQPHRLAGDKLARGYRGGDDLDGAALLLVGYGAQQVACGAHEPKREEQAENEGKDQADETLSGHLAAAVERAH